MQQQPLTEEQAFTALKAGDEKGLGFFFDRYYTPLIYFAQSILKEHSIAEEIAAEAFVKLWRVGETLFEARKVKFFLYQVVRNGCIDELRRRKAHAGQLKVISMRSPSQEESCLHALAETETHYRLYTLINKLPFKCRQVFEMFYFQDKAMKEIAEELGISVNTVKTHKQRALQILKDNSSSLYFLAIILLVF